MIENFFENLMDWITTIGISFIIIALLNIFIVKNQIVDGKSMYPTLKHTDRIFLNKISYRFTEPKRGDIVVFEHTTPGQKSDFIKRIIALPGEKIKIENNDVYIYNEENPQGYILKEEYIQDKSKNDNFTSFLKPGETFEVPKDNFIVFGDNRGASSDSRMFGYVKKEDIEGKLFIRYWPLKSFGGVK